MSTEKSEEKTIKELFDNNKLEKLKKDGNELAVNRTKSVAEYLHNIIVQHEYNYFDAVDRKAGTLLFCLPIAASVVAYVGLSLFEKGVWGFPALLYFISTILFILSGLLTWLTLKPREFEEMKIEKIADFEHSHEADYYFTIGRHFGEIIGELKEANKKKATYLEWSQIALLLGLLFVGLCFLLLLM